MKVINIRLGVFLRLSRVIENDPVWNVVDYFWLSQQTPKAKPWDYCNNSQRIVNDFIVIPSLAVKVNQRFYLHFCFIELSLAINKFPEMILKSSSV